MDDSVFHRLYEQYHQDVFKFLIYLTRDREQAEDLAHEVYVRVLRAYAGFEGKSSEKTWLFSIAKNVAIDHFRKNSVRKKHLFDKFDWEKNELVSTGILPEELAALNEEMKELLQALDTCTGDQKMVIVMRYFQDLSIAEAADVLGWTEGKVKTTQHRAIKSLQKKLNALPSEGGRIWMTDKQWDDKKIEDLLSSMPNIQDNRPASEVLAQLKQDERLHSPRRNPIRRVPVPAFVAVAALLVLSLLLPSMLRSNDSVMTKDAESQQYSIANEKADTSMQNAMEENEVAAADDNAESKTLFAADMGVESHVVLPQELDGIRTFRIGLTHAAEFIPVTFLIFEDRIKADFPKGEPDSVALYHKYAAGIPETEFGFDDYHPYKGEITLLDDVVVHTIPNGHIYDMSSSAERIYFDSIFETFNDHKTFKSVDQNGNPAVFSHTGTIETQQLDDGKRPMPYYKYTMPSGKFYLVPAGGDSKVTVIGALALMKEQYRDDFESVVPASVTFDVHVEDEVAVITFKDLLDLSSLDPVETNAMIEGFMLTANNYHKRVKLENIVQSNFGKYDLTSVLPEPVGANPLYLP